MATISVSYATFLAPLAFWAGAALLSWRAATGILGRGRPAVARAARPLAGRLSGVVAAAMSRQRRLLSRGLMIVGLTASFAVSTAVFNATYTQQSRVDAQLTNGADVTASTTAVAGLPSGALAAVRRLNGVAAVQPMMHRYAYVGNDLQDLYGIDPQRITRGWRSPGWRSCPRSCLPSARSSVPLGHAGRDQRPRPVLHPTAGQPGGTPSRPPSRPGPATPRPA